MCICKLCVWGYASYVHGVMQVKFLWDYASYVHDVMQVMYMLKCELNVICKYVNAYASIWMPIQVCECLCKLCVGLNACLTCYASYENAYMQVQHVVQDMCMIMCKFWG